MDNQQIGLSQAIIAQKSISTPPKMKNGLWFLVMVISASVAIAIFAVLTIYRYFNKRQNCKKIDLLIEPSLHNDQTIPIEQTCTESVNEFSFDSVLNEPLADLKSDFYSSYQSSSSQELEKQSDISD